jgi:hypothetical protein
MWPSEKSAASEALFFLYARSDGLDDHQSHREGLTAIFDVMLAPRQEQYPNGHAYALSISATREDHREPDAARWPSERLVMVSAVASDESVRTNCVPAGTSTS